MAQMHHVGREKIYWVTISSRSREDMLKLRDYEIDIFGHTAKIEGDRCSVDGLACASEIKRLKNADYQVEIIRDLDEMALETKGWAGDETVPSV